jgi:hypothetical protein
MGAPKKYIEKRVTFTFRALPDEWKLFNVLMTLKDDTPTDFFTRALRTALEENDSLLYSAKQAMATRGDELPEEVQQAMGRAEAVEKMRKKGGA